MYNSVKSNQGIDDQIIAIMVNKSDLNAIIKVENTEGEEFANSIGALFQSILLKVLVELLLCLKILNKNILNLKILKILYE